MRPNWSGRISTRDMLKLGVNIDHVATLREARYRGRPHGEPDPVRAALCCESAGAHGITAHLREDRRHILDRDVIALRKQVRTRLNLEMANVPEIAGIALKGTIGVSGINTGHIWVEFFAAAVPPAAMLFGTVWLATWTGLYGDRTQDRSAVAYE